MSAAEVFGLFKVIGPLIKNKPARARAILKSKPKLCYDLLKAQLRLGMIARDKMEKALNPPKPAPATQLPPPPQQVVAGAAASGGSGMSSVEDAKKQAYFKKLLALSEEQLAALEKADPERAERVRRLRETAKAKA
jgi:hypothetical protein